MHVIIDIKKLLATVSVKYLWHFSLLCDMYYAMYGG